jgi:hypothetical protein
MLLAPLERVERAADAGGAFARHWWGNFTFAAPEALHAARHTAEVFRDAFFGLANPSAD